jgi:hypothetical protein
VYAAKGSSFIREGNKSTIADNSAYYGKAVYMEEGPKKRDSPVGPEVYLDTAVKGALGGWE